MATTAFNKAPCAPPPKVKKPPACPDCGALECLCRPRFFAGQLLSEQDLNRLDQYIKKKNQLHNRNLHGWGVVNGLKVLCDPCGQITVSKGYAISPCGDDIVVCEDTAVDVCSLIQNCKQQDRNPTHCQPFSAPNNSGCDDLEEEWVLAIKYAESPSRGVTALRGNACACGAPNGACQCQATSSGCATNGSGSCSGNCSGNCSCNNISNTNKPRKAPAQCQPSIICEGYQFDVYRKQATEDVIGASDDDNDLSFGGDLGDVFSCCVQGLLGAISLPPEPNNPEAVNQNRALWHQWCCRTREGLITHFSRHPSTNCELLRSLHTMVCPSPDPNNQNFPQQMSEVADRLGSILLEGLINCLCLALLPPAPEATHDARVPLATVKVRGNDCEILSVCNWTICRKLVSSWPSMSYWFSVIPIGKIFREALDRLCCEGFNFDDRISTGTSPQSATEPQPLTETSIEAISSPASGTASNTLTEAELANTQFSGVRANASARLNPQFNLDREISAVGRFVTATMARGNKPLDPASVLNSISRFNLSTEQPNLEKIESRNLPQLLLLNSLARPLIQSSFTAKPKPTSEKPNSEKPNKAANSDDLITAIMQKLTAQPADNDMQKQLSTLEAKLEEQQVLINELQKLTSKKTTRKKAVAKKPNVKKRNQ